ncbi:GNAT family N-acetyltransferase [Silvimonas soli]|uniref:GNAT family N-acetyltransferase n=1 Tax=Silvimonas soli TaxID=2980100 RepID=UPI0024B37368|nr:GNAT family N-acetyltransferase [Silvimonas soli]
MTHIERHSDPHTFAAALTAWLGEQYWTHNQLYTMALRITPALCAERQVHFYLLKRAGQTLGAALVSGVIPTRTLFMTDLDHDAIDCLRSALRDDDVLLTDVIGPQGYAESFAAVWGEFEPRVALGNHRLMTEPVSTGAAGYLRAATDADEALLARWFLAFCEECDMSETAAGALGRVAGWLQTNPPMVWIWEVDHQAAAFCVTSPHAPLARIGPVYTTPEQRGRGYAGAMVAAASAHLQASGIRDVFLYTDLANPISNSVYQRIGFAQISQHTHLDLVS